MPADEGASASAIPSARRRRRARALSSRLPCDAQREIQMSSDGLLLALIIAGFGLSGAYLRAGYISWLRNQAAERKRELSLRELRADSLCRDENDVPGSSTGGKPPGKTGTPVVTRNGNGC